MSQRSPKNFSCLVRQGTSLEVWVYEAGEIRCKEVWQLPATPHNGLAELLGLLFGAEELRGFLWGLPSGRELYSTLPANLSPSALARAAVMSLDRRGLIDSELFRRIAQARPRRLQEIACVAFLWGFNLPPVLGTAGKSGVVQCLRKGDNTPIEKG